MSDSELKIEHEGGAAGHLIRLSGTIDTNFPRAKLLELSRGVVVFDLEGVQRITSYGVREWIKTLRELPAEYCCFVKCRPAMMMQFNLVVDFAGRGELLSFYLPYVCPDCGEPGEQLMDVRTQYADLKAFSVPPYTCKKCGSAAEFDDLPDAYLSYPATTPVPLPPPIVDALLSGKAIDATPFRIEKHVTDSITAIWLSGSLRATGRFKRLADGLEGTVLLLLGGMNAVAPNALAQLRPLFDATSFETYLARVPRSVAPALLEAGPAMLGRAKVASVLVTYHCPSCTAYSEQEIDALELRAVGPRTGPARACPVCGVRATPDPSPEILALVQTLEPLTVPEDVRSYLATNLAPPAAESRGANLTPTGPIGLTGLTGLSAVGGIPGNTGRYEIVRRLGAGGMAEVFLARQTSVGGFAKRVVLKRILPHLSGDQQFVTMFLTEAKLAARISHPNVTQIYDVWQEGAQFLIAMEYVRGWDLNVLLKTCRARSEALPVHLAAFVVSQVAAGLHAAHSCTDESGSPLSIVHRDVSPHNVLIALSGEAKISDFGIAKAMDGSSRTPTNQLKGKLTYMAPEQATNGIVDARADIFPTGLTLYECLTLEHMFARASDLATFQAILNDPIPHLRDRVPTAPPELQTILEKACARDPAQRYQTARALAEELDRFQMRLGRIGSASELSEWLAARMPPVEDAPASVASNSGVIERTLIRDRSRS